MTGSAVDRPIVVAACRVCGKLIERDPGRRGRPQRYCSPECRATGRRLPAEPVIVRGGGAATPFAEALREAMRRSGLPLRALASRVEEHGGQISAAALGAWQNGTSTPVDPFASTLRALELALDLSLGDLTLAMLPAEPAPGRTSERELPAATSALPREAIDLDELLAAAGRVQEAVRAVTGSQRLIVTRLRSHYRVGGKRLPVKSETELTVRAVHDEIDSYWFLHAATGDGGAEVVAGNNCTVHRNITELRNMQAVELVFDSVLSRGESYTFSFATEYHYNDSASEPPFFAKAVSSPLESADLELSFAVPPTVLYECDWSLQRIEQGQETARRALAASATPPARKLEQPRPSAYGWSWDWSE